MIMIVKTPGSQMGSPAAAVHDFFFFNLEVFIKEQHQQEE